MRTAVILAAGMGTRLGEHGERMPKGFLRLGERPIVEESVLRLRKAGCTRIIVVTGHCGEFYSELAKRFPDVKTAPNPQYAGSGSMYSLYCARKVIENDFLLLESDLIYEQRALQFLLEYEKPDAILLSGPTHAGDEVYVQTRNGYLVNMSKEPAALGRKIAGELVGISKISFALFQHMLELAAKQFEHTLDVDYETDCLVAAASAHAIPCPVVEDLLWAEIDDEGHLARARQQVYPAIRTRDGLL